MIVQLSHKSWITNWGQVSRGTLQSLAASLLSASAPLASDPRSRLLACMRKLLAAACSVARRRRPLVALVPPPPAEQMVSTANA